MDQKVFSFNSFKHHLQSAKQMILLSQKTSCQNFTSVPDEIKQIGNNVMDLYTGSMTVDLIYDEISCKLEKFNITGINDYKEWLGSPGYKKIELTDNSVWIMRLGLIGGEFIHIHPARFGKHVIRITGSAWKTAMAAAIFENKIPGQFDDSKMKINYVRTQFLDLSPVKKIIPGSSLDIALKHLGIG